MGPPCAWLAGFGWFRLGLRGRAVPGFRLASSSLRSAALLSLLLSEAATTLQQHLRSAPATPTPRSRPAADALVRSHNSPLSGEGRPRTPPCACARCALTRTVSLTCSCAPPDPLVHAAKGGGGAHKTMGWKNRTGRRGTRALAPEEAANAPQSRHTTSAI